MFLIVFDVDNFTLDDDLYHVILCIALRDMLFFSHFCQSAYVIH